MSNSGYSNLQLRVMSAVVMVIFVLLLTWFGGLPFRLLSAAIAGGMFYEWLVMTPGGLKTRPALLALLFSLALVLLLIGADALIVLGAIVVAGFVAAVFAETKGQGQWIAKGFAYASISGFALAFLRGDSAAGLIAILFLFAIVWITDIGAYFTGRSLGGPKLAPSISPGKTWSGAIGGTLGGVAGGMIVANVAGVASHGLFVIALLLSVVSQIGDLFESSVKRQAGVKDSGNIIPGHGGVMDRVDGLVAAAIALYCIGLFTGGMNQPASVLFAVP